MKTFLTLIFFSCLQTENLDNVASSSRSVVAEPENTASRIERIDERGVDEDDRMSMSGKSSAMFYFIYTVLISS